MQLLRAPTSIAGQNNHRIVVPGNGSIPGNIYALDGKGCVLVQQSDLAWFVSQGFSPPDSLISDLFVATGVIASGTSSVVLGILPASYYLEDLIFSEVAGQAITGGVNVGSSPGAADVVAALAIPANALVVAVDVAKLKRAFSTIASTQLFVSAGGSWNGANLQVKALLRPF